MKTAQAVVSRGDADGIGIVLGSGMVGVDLDHCRDAETGTIEEWALEIIRAVDSYGEVSPSGTGVHILAKGELPAGRRRKGQVEIYADGRFFTLTGRQIEDTPRTIEERTAELAEVHARVFGANSGAVRERHRDPGAPLALDDADLVRRAEMASNGGKFTRLWAGDRTGYASASEADLALCAMLAFWSGADAGRMDRLFRQSGLFREKWDERHGTETYGERTIAAALERCTETYSPHHSGNGRSASARPAFSGSPSEAPVAWPEPKPFPSGLPAVESFQELLLPRRIRAWIADVADRMQCPPDFASVAVMVALAAVIGRRVGIRPKRHDDWLVVGNLWGFIVGRPGFLKTPAAQEALTPLRRLEAQAAKDHDEAMRLYEAALVVAGERGKVRKDRIRKQLKAGAALESLAAELAAEEDPAAPLRHRYIANDPTVEALQELLQANPNGILLFRDELTGWLRSLDREGRESDRSFYLEAWTGTGRFTVDRIGRGTRDIEAATVSLFGTIQPGPLREYLRAAADGGAGDDGLMQRFQLAVWPDTSSEWSNVDRWPDTAARQAASAVFDELAALAPEDVGAQRDELDRDGIPFVRFDSAAQEAFDGWRDELEPRLRSGKEHPAIESHLAKYRSLVPSLALIHHLADGGRGPIGEVAVLTAVAWAHYLESHARRIYSSVAGEDVVPGRALLEKLRGGDLGDGFTLRDVYRPQWSGLSRPDDARSAVELLEDLGWIRNEMQDTGGRPKTVYRVHPGLEAHR